MKERVENRSFTDGASSGTPYSPDRRITGDKTDQTLCDQKHDAIHFRAGNSLVSSAPNFLRPLVFDLYCGLGGWSEAFIAQGYRAVGFDVERHDYGSGGYPGELVLRDVRSLTGAELVKQYGIPAVIVASPPCQEFSYMAMPWSRAKQKEREILNNPAERTRLTDLFNQCFRIQREVSEAAGHYVPIISEGAKLPNNNSARSQDFTRVAGRQGEGVKKRDEGYDYEHRTFGWKAPPTSSKSRKRKEASALIAKIPPGLADWIARCFKPERAEIAAS